MSHQVIPCAPHFDGEFNTLPQRIAPLSLVRPCFSMVTAQLPSGAGQTVDLPGPDAGYVRVYNSLHIVPDPVAALTSVKIEFRDSVGSLYLHQAATSISSGNAHNTAFGMVLFSGESVRFTNGGANTATVVGMYVDVPAYGIVPIRVQLTAGGVTIVPAAPSGFVSRLFAPGAVGSTSAISTTGGPRLWNADAVGHTFELTYNGAIVNHIASVAAGATSGYGGPCVMPITTVPLVARVGEAVNTTAPWLLYAYETFELEA